VTIEVGASLPSAMFTVMTPEGPKVKTTEEIFKNRKVVLFGVPGAFTPVCTVQHLAGFLQNAAAFKAKAIDEIAVTSVNDVFVMSAWAKDNHAADQITFLADGNATFAKALDLILDLTERGLGIRSKRYSMLVEDGVVKQLNIEETPGKAEASGAEALLKQI
jgi:peroxiredoxin